MKKCRTCKHWEPQGFHIGNCTGISCSAIVIPIENQPKGKPNGKLITKPGLISNATFFKTHEEWNCKNWRKK